MAQLGRVTKNFAVAGNRKPPLSDFLGIRVSPPFRNIELRIALKMQKAGATGL
jgi:hypothetical protein